MFVELDNRRGSWKCAGVKFYFFVLEIYFIVLRRGDKFELDGILGWSRSVVYFVSFYWRDFGAGGSRGRLELIFLLYYVVVVIRLKF